MIGNLSRQFGVMCAASAVFAVLAVAPMSGAVAADTAGLVIAIGNGYDDFLPASPRDAEAIAGKLEGSGFTAVRFLNKTGSEMAAGIAQIREDAKAAGPVRVVYTSGFGMCIDADLVLFAEDLQPEQVKSGQLGDVAVSISVVAEAAAEGATQTLVVFDANPRQCTSEVIKAVELPENTVLMVTTGIGGDVIDEVDEGGLSAFTTIFLEDFTSDGSLQDIVTQVVERVRALTEDQQQPVLVGEF